MMRHYMAVCVFGLALAVGACGGGGENEVSAPHYFDTADEVLAPDNVAPRQEISAVPYLETGMHAPVTDRRRYGKGIRHIGTEFDSIDCKSFCNSDVEETIYGSYGTSVGVGPRRLEAGDDKVVSTEALIAYLQDDVMRRSYNPESRGTVARFGNPPVVLINGNASSTMFEDLMQAVQIVNDALPLDWRLKFNESFNPVDGEITVSFTKPSTRFGDPSGGHATWEPSHGSPIESGTIEVDPTYWTEYGDGQIPGSFRRGREVGVAVLVHEIIHVLGRDHIPGSTPLYSLMSDPLRIRHDFMLHELDRNALLAVYSRLSHGDTTNDIAEKLGNWEDEYAFVSGAYGSQLFGVIMNNGTPQPWVHGRKPEIGTFDIRNNMSSIQNGMQDEVVRWKGELVGLTPEASVVSGDASLGIDMRTLGGVLDFNDLRSWGRNTLPGTGAGATWGDGDLSYNISLDSRTGVFIQGDGEDAGVVTGSLLGDQLEYTGGVLRRDDLGAAFGGIREGSHADDGR